MSKTFRPDRPLVLGVAGGIASGKSTVASMIAAHGLVHLDADREARRVVAQPDCLAAIRRRFGDAVFDASGALDRAALAERVFADRQALRDLEAITHPAVRAALELGIDAALASGRSVVLDVPLLFEGGLVERCDVCIFVDADEATRRARAAERGWDPGELARREAAQASLGVKKSRCRYTVSTSGSLSDTQERVAAILARIAEHGVLPGP